MPLRRRDFLKTTATGLAATALDPSALLAAPVPARKPNIVLIMSDEHNPAICGFMGNKIVRTPNMDALAKEGIVLDNHYCNSPLCSPSRMSFTSGKYVSRVSAWNNRCDLPNDNVPSLPRMVKAAGYDAFLCGKMHYDRTRRYGWTEIGGNFNNNFKDGLGHRMEPEQIDSDKLSDRFKEFHTGDDGGTVKHDRRVTAAALDFLKARKADDKPFLLHVGYLAPHFPLIVPEEWDKYQGKIAMPEIPAGFLDSLPNNYKNLRAGFQICHVPDATVKRGRELYYALTEWIDNEIGKVIAQLRANKELAENTIIIYTSDHGENMGEHGLWWKNCMYEHASHVPTIISFPKRWKGGQRRTLTSSHVDLVQTIVALTGGKTPKDWNGHSMLPWLDNPNHHWKDFALSEYYAHNISSGYVMVRTGTWKYTYHTPANARRGAEHELYDLSTDPYEFHNLAAKPEHAQRVKKMHQMMMAELKKSPDKTEQQCRRELAVGYNRKDKLPTDKVNTDE